VKLTINTDGAATKSNPRRAGAGAIVRGEDGRTFAEVSAYLGEMDHHQAEYMGLILGLTVADALGAEKVEVRTDSRLVVAQLSGYGGSRPWRVKAENLRRLNRLAARLADVFHTRPEWVPRKQNKDADRLAGHAADRGWGTDLLG
jgi:probable phosphoglycerate mutase